MAAKTESKGRKKSKRAQRTRHERRFVPATSQAATLTMVGTVLGGLAVGAGVYGRWLVNPPVAYAWIGVVAGAAVLAAVVLWGHVQGLVIRVGDAGVAWESDNKNLKRVAWCEMTSVSLKGGELKLKTEEGTVAVPVRSNPLAVAWILREAEDRMPKILEVDKAERDKLPSTGSSDGESVAVDQLQLTGKKCKASGQVITFERDVRLCPKCGELYHQSAVPKRCMTCEAEMDDDA